MEKNEILIIYGKNIEAMAVNLAEEADLAGLIGDRGKLIGLKPNLLAAHPASEGATTHVEIVTGLISYLKKSGFNNLVILEGAWTGGSTTQAFKTCGYSKLARETGVKLIDTKQDRAKNCNCGGMDIEICESALSIDFMINLPLMKGHCQTHLTCALKNNKGVIPDREKRRFHSIGLHKPIAHLNTFVRNDFILVDCICPDPDFENGGNPLYSNRLFAATDPVLCDAWSANQMGYSLKDIPYIGLAEKLGIGSADFKNAKVRELNDKSKSGVSGAVMPSGKARKAAEYITENNSCSACFASLIYALSRLNHNELSRIKERISVGQGFKGKQGNIGTGNCCNSFRLFCPGCPPSGADILDFLRAHI
jgi:uncharacterized protein (DUF362 family)